MAEGRYVYCIAEGSEVMRMDKIGIEDNDVYTIPYQDISAVVHNCPSRPYESEDKELVEKWIIDHENVIETVQEKAGTVLPLGFDTIIKADGEENAEEKIKDWLKEDYQKLKEKLNKIKGKAEYAVQISWDAKIIAKKLIERDEELKRLDEEIKSKPKGAAYMYKQKLEKLLRSKLEEEANRRFKDFYEKIKHCVDEIKVEKLKKEEEPRQMLMNLSCLSNRDDKTLGDELEKISKRVGFFVRFTGPWPPYSFV